MSSKLLKKCKITKSAKMDIAHFGFRLTIYFRIVSVAPLKVMSWPNNTFSVAITCCISSVHNCELRAKFVWLDIWLEAITGMCWLVVAGDCAIYFPDKI